MKKNFLLRGLLVASILAFGSGAAHAELKDIRDAKKIRIALDTGSPPYGFMGSDLKPTGSDVETARLLAKDLGVDLEIVQVTSPNRIPFLQSGKAPNTLPAETRCRPLTRISEMVKDSA